MQDSSAWRESGPPKLEATPVEFANRLAYLARTTAFVLRRYAKSSDLGKHFEGIVGEAWIFVDEIERVAGVQPSISGPMFRPYVDHVLLVISPTLRLELLCETVRTLLEQANKGTTHPMELREVAETLKQLASGLEDLAGHSSLYRSVR